MKLAALIQGIYEFQSSFSDVEIKGLHSDSRQIQSGFLFVALVGGTSDGHDYLDKAIELGAAALLVSDPSRVPSHFSGAVVVGETSRVLLAQLAARFYDQPSMELCCIGVTGTNGKTSVTCMLESLLTQLGQPTGVLGTIDHHLGSQVWPTSLTTPDVVDLQARLAQMKQAGAENIAFEVSSHALEQGRIAALNVSGAIFTNLTRDHLDYHGTMENYFFAKEKLFSESLWMTQRPRPFAVINIDDEYGRRIQVADQAKRWTFGQSADADFCFEVLSQSFEGSEIKVVWNGQNHFGFVPVPGLFNVYNAMAAMVCVVAKGHDFKDTLKKMESFKGVPGRLQRVRKLPQRSVFVDYAHTSDALQSVLSTLTEIRASQPVKIITVCGFGGDRDKGKRPLMTKAAMSMSDIVVLTSDNPRTEDPEVIIDDGWAVVPQDRRNQSVFRVTDRRQAIEKALALSNPKDVVLIAGKGHESYQILKDRTIDFDDVLVAEESAKKIFG